MYGSSRRLTTLKDIFSESEIEELLKHYSQLKQLEIRNNRFGSMIKMVERGIPMKRSRIESSKDSL